MIEVRFRAWDKTRREYIEVGILNFEYNYLVIKGKSLSQGLEQFILEQFTGLHDKNGVEIYEGDIIKGKEWEHGKSHRHIGIVTYISNSFRSVGINQYLGYHGSVDGSYEIIGNIHESEDK